MDLSGDHSNNAHGRSVRKLTKIFIETASSPAPFVYRLPSETIEAIFIICANNYHIETRGSPTRTPPSWVNVSYVSHRWRHIALNCPTLWSYLFITSPRWSEELLARSKKAPLKLRVTYDEPDHWTTRFLEELTNHVERIEELDLHFPLWYHDICVQYIAKLCSRRASRLRTLQISSDRLPPVLLIHSPFGGDTPTLRTLDFSYCPVPWNSFKLSRLTTLRLFRVPVQLRTSMEEFLAMLGCMQDLTLLYLVDALPRAAGLLSNTALETFQKISLPHLAFLNAHVPLSTVIALLSSVSVPSTTELRVSYDVEAQPPDDFYTPMCSAFAQRLSMIKDQGLLSLTIRTLIIIVSEFGPGSRIAFSTTERRDILADRFTTIANLPRHSDLYLSIPMSNDINNVCCSMPLTNIQNFYINSPPLSSEFWRALLRHLPNLRYLKLSDGYMPGLVPMFSLSQPGCAEIHDRIYAENLEDLELAYITFAKQQEGDQDSDSLEGIDVQTLLDALATRKAPRGRLTMTECVETISDAHQRVLNLTAWWEGGSIDVVEED